MVKLRDEGVIEHIGVAGGPVGLMLKYLATDRFEAVISHNDTLSWTSRPSL